MSKIDEIISKSHCFKCPNAPEPYIDNLKAEIKQAVLEAVGQEAYPEWKDKIRCDCPCDGPFCDSFVHECKNPTEHYLQRDEDVIKVRNELRKEIKERIEKLFE